jgi:YfiH family protein
MPFVFKEAKGLGFYEVSGWAGARGLFTTRMGGVSPAPYNSLNLGAGGGDDPKLVARNRDLLAGSLGLDLSRIKTVNQVHGSSIYEVGDPGSGRPLRGYDAMITSAKGVAIGVLTADCVPILMYDPGSSSVASVHAGWAGTVKGIAGRTVTRMGEVYGTKPSDLLVAIGPSIGPCCYEVDEKVIGPLKDAQSGWSEMAAPARKGRWMLDLWETNRRIMIDAGVRPENVTVMSLCTACNQDKFFSHRKSGGKAGRMMAIALLK